MSIVVKEKGARKQVKKPLKKKVKDIFEPKMLKIQIEGKLKNKVTEAICNLLGLGFEPKTIKIQIKNKLQSKVTEAICNLLGLHFEEIIPEKE